ncbi:MAG: hypothetical protein FJX66_14635 [Alphaproteobacteria bacterium]|nr:hypothetical protein [Alphaproteobacteria bacterium]
MTRSQIGWLSPACAISVPLLALLLSACAGSLHWEHPVTGQQNLAADREECRRLADDEAWRYYRPLSLFGPFTPFHHRFGHRRFWYSDPFYDHDRFFRAAELRDFCMKSRGYRLVPDAPEK